MMTTTFSKEDFEELCRNSEEVYAAVNKYEVARRKVYLHANLRYDMPQVKDRTMRSQGLHWVRLNGVCEKCNNRHAKISVNTYLMWHVYVPFECDHKGTIDSVRMETDIDLAMSQPEISMPLTYVPKETSA